MPMHFDRFRLLNGTREPVPKYVGYNDNPEPIKVTTDGVVQEVLPGQSVDIPPDFTELILEALEG